MKILRMLKGRLLTAWKAKALLIGMIFADAVILAFVIGIWSDLGWFKLFEIVAIVELAIVLIFAKFFLRKAIALMYSDDTVEDYDEEQA